ncbi:hypothetical protein O5O45_02595 [Hahella aquimaris]|uniref:hypothetical protein n=1 Tax=Hahella sp. HNIBRBA332 TaxID=3015983 RepID=UPI00273B2A51|nr:hypothetical protein [Hahella sp. HNIBRBA332]WLQ14825.1 hypothetical protein O5O45_02595 [Hahella sp. HNIBRBA332]
MSKKFHLAIAVIDIEQSVEEYNERLGRPADVVVPGEYALWRTKELNFSIRKTAPGEGGRLRHLGWEDSEAKFFTCDKDCNGILWEEFSASQQAAEIKSAWPGTDYKPGKNKDKKSKKNKQDEPPQEPAS